MKFIPRPVVVGFTNGIAVIIASTQIKDFFGLNTGPRAWRISRPDGNRSLPTSRRCRFRNGTCCFRTCHHFALHAIREASARRTLWRCLSGHVAVVVFRLPVETIGTRFGGIPSGLPHLQIPKFRLDLDSRPLISPAITVAMLGAIESLMSAVVSDRMSGDKHNPNVELVGQGIANIVSPLFGGTAGDGGNCPHGHQHPLRSKDASRRHDSRADAAVRSAVRRAAGEVHSAVGAGGDSLVVAYNMGEWREIPELLKLSQTRDRHLVDHLRADRLCRSDGGRGGGDDYGGAACSSAK